MCLEVIIIAEAQADFEIAIGLARRVDTEAGAGHDLQSRGLDASAPFTVWSSVRSAAAAKGRKLRGFALSRGPFKGGDAETAWQVAALCSLEPPAGSAPAMLLIRDTDNDMVRAKELAQAVGNLRANGISIMLAQPHPKREAWVLHGFEPMNGHEQKLLKKQVTHLGMDPRTDSHRLTEKGRKGKLNAKVVLDALTGNDRQRESACWQGPPLAVLKGRGKRTGLTAYLKELQQWLAKRD